MVKNFGKHIKIIWCARFIEWKHPEMAVLLAERLHNKGYDFELNMIGSGKLYGKIERMINDKGLSSCVHLLGNYPNEEVLRMMEEHQGRATEEEISGGGRHA